MGKKINIDSLYIGKKMRIRFEGLNPIRERNIVITNILENDFSYGKLIVFRTWTKAFGWVFIIKPYWELQIWNNKWEKLSKPTTP